jgi:hypothetical protein
MVTSNVPSGSGPGNPGRDPIPVTMVFDGPPGVEGLILVGTEHGDINIHTEIDGHEFCVFVLTMNNALTLSMWLCAHIVDERHRSRQP